METACSSHQQYSRYQSGTSSGANSIGTRQQTSGCAAITIFMLIVLMMIMLLVVYIYVSSPDPPKLQVDSIVVSPFNVSGGNSPVTANWDIGLSIRNPSKFGYKIYYEPMDLSVYYKTEFLTGTNIKPFVQQAKNQTSLMASSSLFEKRFDGWVSANMSEDLKRGSVDFKVTLHGWVHFKHNFWVEQRAWIEGSCPDVPVIFLSPTTAATTGTMLGGSGSRRCNVKIREDNHQDYVIYDQDDHNDYHY